MIFVFGSNLLANHAGGAAREAFLHFGASYDIAVGPSGRSYAIPTMGKDMKPLPLDEIRKHVEDFLEHAWDCIENEFFVTAIGCGIAGYTPEQIAPMFKDAPMNCTLHRRLVEALSAPVMEGEK